MNRSTTCTAEQLASSSDLYQLLSYFLLLPSRELAAALAAGSLRGDLEDILDELGFAKEHTADTLQLLKGYETRRDEDELHSPSKSVSCSQGSRTLMDADACMDEGKLLKELRIDYTQMFGHPEHPSVHIYESLVLHDHESTKPKPRLFTDKIALDCEGFYEQAGLQSSGAANEPGDHLATQLQFLSYLYGKASVEAQAAAEEAHATPDEAQSASAEGQNTPENLAKTLKLLDAFGATHLGTWAKPFFARVYENAQTDAYRAFALVIALINQHE